jgi:preprotein translocase subunit SecG
MDVLRVLLLVFFVIVAFLLILLVLIQNEEGDSLGGIFAGGSGSAFGSRSGNVLTRTTSVLGALFLIISLSLALVNRTPAGSGVEAAGRQSAPEADSDWWQDGDAAAPLETAPEFVFPEGIAPESESLIEETSPVEF